MHCKLIPIKGKFFRGKPVYSCSSCGLTLGLEDPNTKVLCKVEAAKSDVTELLTKRMYHREDKVDANNLLGDKPVELHKGMSLRDKVAAIYKDRLINNAKQDGRIADNKDNTVAYEVLNQQAQDYAENYIAEKSQPFKEELSEEDKKKLMCTQEEINQRLSICETCEYYENNTAQLFNLAEDPGEQNDLSIAEPEKVNNLRQLLDNWRTNVNAKTMSPNAEYDSSAVIYEFK